MFCVQNSVLNAQCVKKLKDGTLMSESLVALLAGFFGGRGCCLSAKSATLVSILGSACVNILALPAPRSEFLYRISSDLAIWNQLQEIHLDCFYFHKKPRQECFSQRWISTSNMLLSALLFMFQRDFVAFSSQECVTLCCLYIEDINGHRCHFSF